MSKYSNSDIGVFSSEQWLSTHKIARNNGCSHIIIADCALLFMNRTEVQPCLIALCAGVIDSEIISALQGLLMASPLVRGAALQALTSIPSFAAGVCPEDNEILAILMIALHDPNETNQEAGVALWTMAGAHIPASFVNTIPPYLSSPHADLRQAATEALVEGLETFPDSSGDVLHRCIAVFAGENILYQLLFLLPMQFLSLALGKVKLKQFPAWIPLDEIELCNGTP